jgi:hypothetical protein
MGAISRIAPAIEYASRPFHGPPYQCRPEVVRSHAERRPPPFVPPDRGEFGTPFLSVAEPLGRG